MTAPCELIVFTDLDGTLIDHHTYDFSPALPALQLLKRMSAGLVLASSKTAPEIQKLRAEIGCADWPAIVENGAGLLPPQGTQTPDDTQYKAIRTALESLPSALRTLFRGFGDVTTAEIVAMTGLSNESARLAQERSFSEPGLWSGSDQQRAEFLARLATQGISAQQGGRFLTLSYGANKVDQMRAITKAHHPRHTVALGDAPNDIAMLEAADTAVIVANPTRAPLQFLRNEASGNVIRTKDAGPVGWNLAMCDILKRLQAEQDSKHG